MSVIAILSNCADLHSHFVHDVLSRKGKAVVWFDGPDYPGQLTVSCSMHGGRSAARFDGVAGGIDGSDVHAVWARRAFEAPIVAPDLARMERREAGQVRMEAFEMRRCFLGVFAEQAYWVNPYRTIAAADNKALQLRCAVRCGFEVPETLMSNAPAQIRAFIARHAGQVIYKSFNPVDIGTTRVAVSDLPEDDALVQLFPGIFQALVVKSCELRVCVVGDRVLAFRIESQATQRGRLDWRNAYDEIDIVAVTLPDAIAARCLRLCRALDLEYGALDLIETPDGRTVFLEVNESGQFAFLENIAHRLGHPAHPVVDAVAEMLAQGRRDFDWSPRGRHLWGADAEVHAAAIARLQAARAVHAVPADWNAPLPDGSNQARFNFRLEQRRVQRQSAAIGAPASHQEA